MADAEMIEDLRYLIGYLEEERDGALLPLVGRTHPFLLEDDEEELFAAFRALVNVRPAQPVGEGFLTVQGRMLRACIARDGIVEASALPACEADQRICLWQGDITRLQADAIVNAANSGMLGCFAPGHLCIDNCIHTFAGVQLRLECARMMEVKGHPEPTGRALVTSAYNLPARLIIHTVGPIVMQGLPTDIQRRQLAACYESCLDAAARMDGGSIAFCCISTGVFGYPQEDAAHVAVDTVTAWLDAHPKSSVSRVVFDTFSSRDTKIYQELLQR